MFCYQQSFFNPTRVVGCEQFWALVGAPRTRELIDGIRQEKAEAARLLQAGDTEGAKEHEQEAARLKKKLPAFIFQATFDVTKSKKGFEGAWRKQAATRLNGLVVMDIDHVTGEGSGCAVRKVWEEACAKLSEAERERILLVYVTPSGKGLKIVFKADPQKGNLIDNQLAMARELGMKVDESCKDASRMSFICKKEDILFINDQELFTYENKEFGEKYNEQYRRGNSQPTLPFADDDEPRGDHANGDNGKVDGGETAAQAAENHQQGSGTAEDLSYNGWKGSLSDLLRAFYPEKQPGPEEKGGSGMSRHTESLKWAYDLLVMTGRNKQRTEQLLRSIPWVKDIVEERGEDVEQTVKDADARVGEREKKYGAEVKVSKAMQAALKQLMEAQGLAQDEAQKQVVNDFLPLDDWGQQIKELAADFPCVKEALGGLPLGGYAAGLFVSAAFLGTLMTRTWYYFYHRPEEMRRLNYCVMVIGDPASGKSFATRLYKLLAAPIKTADKVGYEAVNRYKEDTRSKGANKEKPKKPQVVIRDHPARTSNATFIQDMNNAVETVDGQPMHLHLLTFDSELDNATLTQRGGSWIDKSSLELKAFHNEEDGQAYSNLDSISGTFNVYWNYVYTGTPLSLQWKVTERNFGSGLATRLAVIPLPPSGFQMMGLQRRQTIDHQADETLKTWAFRLDGVKGELPLWPLVEECWHWTDERMFAASLEKDKADELLLKRVAYYGICISAPFILMRHWDEWKKNQSFEIDDTDRRLCRLVLNIQYRCQHYFFESYARAYFENMERDQSANRVRESKYDEAYKRLPQEFTIKDIEETYGVIVATARSTAKRLCDGGFVERLKKGNYRKLKQTLI